MFPFSQSTGNHPQTQAQEPVTPPRYLGLSSWNQKGNPAPSPDCWLVGLSPPSQAGQVIFQLQAEKKTA